MFQFTNEYLMGHVNIFLIVHYTLNSSSEIYQLVNEDRSRNILLYILLAVIFTIYALHRPKLKIGKKSK